MGVHLDSSVLIACERLRLTPMQTLERFRLAAGDTHFGISALALTEVLHAIYRTPDPSNRHRRQSFIEGLIEEAPVYPYLAETARLAARISGEQAAIGQNIPFADLLIGATALSLNFSILTTNLRHFRMIPNLEVISF